MFQNPAPLTAVDQQAALPGEVNTSWSQTRFINQQRKVKRLLMHSEGRGTSLSGLSFTDSFSKQCSSTMSHKDCAIQLQRYSDILQPDKPLNMYVKQFKYS